MSSILSIKTGYENWSPRSTLQPHKYIRNHGYSKWQTILNITQYFLCSQRKGVSFINAYSCLSGK